MNRYLGAIVISFLIVAWIAVVCLQGRRLYNASQVSEAVARGTRTVGEQLSQPRLDVLQDKMFPEGQIINAVKTTWRTGIKVRGYPSSLIDEPPDASGRVPVTTRIRGR